MVLLPIEEEQKSFVIHQVLEEYLKTELCWERLLSLHQVEEVLLELELLVRRDQSGLIRFTEEDVRVEEEHVAEDQQVLLPLLDVD